MPSRSLISGRIATTRSTGPRLDGFYTWRDPARVTPALRAELEARDAKYAEPDRRNPGAADGADRRGQALKAQSAQRQAEYARLIAAGHDRDEAAAAVGVQAETARRWERASSQEAAQ